MGTSTALPLVDETLSATTRYLQALTTLDDQSVRRPSVLPGWTRAHVVAHLSRNADAFTRVLVRAAAGQPAWMYDSNASRDADIEDTVRRLDAAGLVADARESSARLADALTGYDGDPAAPYTRVPPDQPGGGGAESFTVDTVGPRRQTEVEIHHSDLDLGSSPAGWPPAFSQRMIRQRLDDSAALASGPGAFPSMVLSSTDVPGLWKFGSGQGPEIHGTAGDLAWWLVGRGGDGLTCSSGELPVLGRWR